MHCLVYNALGTYVRQFYQFHFTYNSYQTYWMGGLFALVVVPAWFLPNFANDASWLQSSHTRIGHCRKAQGRYPRSCHEVRHQRVVYSDMLTMSSQLTYVHLSLPAHTKILRLTHTFTS
jgi:hypothetical protein